jgi:quercetin dioxygenase-like cupin family protein
MDRTLCLPGRSGGSRSWRWARGYKVVAGFIRYFSFAVAIDRDMLSARRRDSQASLRAAVKSLRRRASPFYREGYLLMKNHAWGMILPSVFVQFLFATSLVGADVSPGATNSVTLIRPQEIRWIPSPNLPRVQVAVMDGDPKKPGASYTLRLKLPDAYTIPLHWHPDTERLTVLTGVVLFGAGDKMDPAKTTALGPGSYIVIPATARHWVTARGSTIFQVSGLGPFTVNFVK